MSEGKSASAAEAIWNIEGRARKIQLAEGLHVLAVGAVAASSVMAASYAMVVWRLDVYATVPLVVMGLYLASAKRLGAFEAL